MNRFKILAILASSIVLTACGLKGELYLPEKAPMPTESIQSIESATIDSQASTQP